MRLIKPSYEILPPVDYGKLLERIELIGRTCYKSEDKIGPGTAEAFISRIIKSGHESVLEHGTFCFEIMNIKTKPAWVYLENFREIQNIAVGFNYSSRKNYSSIIISCNVRTIRDACKEYPNNSLLCSMFGEIASCYPIISNSLFGDLEFGPERYYDLRLVQHQEILDTFAPYELKKHFYMTVRFICDRGVSHELVRHRVAAFSQESTRYCNYGGGVTFIIPPWVDGIEEGNLQKEHIIKAANDLEYSENRWLTQLFFSEETYLQLLDKSWSPQQARSVLPNSLKTEIVMTANMGEWDHVFALRTDKAAHPQMRELMIPLSEEVRRMNQ